MENKINNIFDWLKEITYNKSPVDSFTKKDWEKFNSWMIHRFISQNLDYIEISNYIQQFNPQEKEKIYTIYKNFIPKKKVFLKYIKNQNKVDYKDVPKYLAQYFECSTREAISYIKILSKKDIELILSNMGIEEKQIKTQLNEIN